MGAFGVTRSFQESPGLEILKFPAGLDAIMSVVVDASTVTPDVDGNRKLSAGTLLTGPNVDDKYEQFAGTGDVAGVLADDTMFASGNAQGDQPAAMFFHGCVFRSDRIVDFTTYETQARTDLPTCRFD
jgi:hypothetical protein